MNTLTLESGTCQGTPFGFVTRIKRELLSRERRLTLYAALLLALLVPMAIAAGLDERTLRGANVWVKPMKFALSIAVLALTTAWFIGHLPRERRQTRAVQWIVGLLIGAGSFELAYITLQAALGQASHYNIGDAFHGIMYSLMGLGALLLSATQPMLAWQLYRHGDRGRPAAYRLAVLLGLTLAFVFGAGIGGLLSGMQPPSTAALPILGWSMQGGDLRPAHFLGLHAAQALPLIGFGIARFGSPPGGRRWVWAATFAYSLLFAAAVVWGLPGRG